MGTRASAGFTIIETMLFLAISGVLVATLIVGTGASINIQRYRDAMTTFKSQLQEQYSYLSSVQNVRQTGWTCDAQANPVAGGEKLAGQSECVVAGRYITINRGDTTTYTILARQVSRAAAANDVLALRNNYVLNIDRNNAETRKLEWNTQIAWPARGVGSQTPVVPRSLAIMIVRSPESGQVYTFTSDNAPAQAGITPTSLRQMVDVTAQGERNICVSSDGFFAPGDMSIYLAPYASTGSAVEIRTNQVIRSTGSTTEC